MTRIHTKADSLSLDRAQTVIIITVRNVMYHLRRATLREMVPMLMLAWWRWLVGLFSKGPPPSSRGTRTRIKRERERERGNGWISTKEGTRRNLIYASVRSSGCVLCEKTLWCIVGWLSGGRIYKVLITACAILTRLVSWYDRPFSTNCEKSPAVNGQTMRLRKVFEPTTRWKDDWLKFRVKVEMWLYVTIV